MPSTDAELIARISQDISRYLDRLQRRQMLWADIDNHIAASHIAEYVGDEALVARHLQTVTRLLIEIHRQYPLRGRSRKKKRPVTLKPARRYRISHFRFAS